MAQYRLISLEHLNADLGVVQQNLADLGFWTDRMYRTDVSLLPIPWIAHGWFYEVGFHEGDIVIPTTNLARFFGDLRSYCGLRDVLRHEYGHAFAYWYPGLVRRSREFTEIFGNRYDSDIESEYDPDEHLTPYAAKSPAEDFAESFMAFVKYKGKLERFRNRPMLYRKIKWVKQLSKLL